MAEYIRKIIVNFEVDTNKRTVKVTRKLESTGDIVFEVENMLDEMTGKLDL